MTFHVFYPLSESRIWDLRPVVITNTTVDMVKLGRKFLYDCSKVRVISIGFSNIDPMGKICYHLKIREFRDKIPSNPWTMQKPFPVGLMKNPEVVLFLPGKSFCEELCGHLFCEIVLQGMAVDQSWVQLLSCLNLLFEHLQVRFNQKIFV